MVGVTIGADLDPLEKTINDAKTKCYVDFGGVDFCTPIHTQGERMRLKSRNTPVRKVGTAILTFAKPLKDGGSDGTRTRGLRRDRPAL